MNNPDAEASGLFCFVALSGFIPSGRQSLLELVIDRPQLRQGGRGRPDLCVTQGLERLCPDDTADLRPSLRAINKDLLEPGLVVVPPQVRVTAPVSLAAVRPQCGSRAAASRITASCSALVAARPVRCPCRLASCLELNLRLERTKRGLSQEEFGDLIGVHRTFVGQLERGQRGTDIRELPGIAKALGVKIERLDSREDGGVGMPEVLESQQSDATAARSR
jgi:DNA-binding XRE family transcriptional regulator